MSSVLKMRTLTAVEMEDGHFFSLLRESAGQNDDELRALIAGDLRAMRVVGAFHISSLVAFAAFRVTEDKIILEYTAVDDACRRQGVGRSLIREIREAHPGALLAETDDDAVEFYRRLNFRISRGTPDPRWPETQRYTCVLD